MNKLPDETIDPETGRTAGEIRANIERLKIEQAKLDSQHLALSTPEGAQAYHDSLIRMMSCSSLCDHLKPYVKEPKPYMTDAEKICSALGAMEGLKTLSVDFQLDLQAAGIAPRDPRITQEFLDQWKEARGL
jgi:hypothetical protein